MQILYIYMLLYDTCFLGPDVYELYFPTLGDSIPRVRQGLGVCIYVDIYMQCCIGIS